MPDHDWDVYAGWETGWYVVTIDPNYGALYAEEDGDGTGSTWFWSSYEGEPIGEYTHVTRDYVESSSGTWYYVHHDGDGKGGDNGWPDRRTYYTQNPGKATEDTTFEYAPGTYTYIGWYEVYLDEDGHETGEASVPYDFSQHVDHNTKLRLHWKKAGTYYLSYAAGAGTLDDGVTKELLLPEGYADYAVITLNRSANAPSGFTFIGWQVRGSGNNRIYTPGQAFTLHGDDAKRGSGPVRQQSEMYGRQICRGYRIYQAGKRRGAVFRLFPENASPCWSQSRFRFSRHSWRRHVRQRTWLT